MDRTARVSWPHPDTDVDYIVICEITGSYRYNGYWDPPDEPDVDIVDIEIDAVGAPELSKEEKKVLVDYINTNCYYTVINKALEWDEER